MRTEIGILIICCGIALAAGYSIGYDVGRKSVGEDCIRVERFHQNFAGQEFRVFKCELQK